MSILINVAVTLLMQSIVVFYCFIEGVFEHQPISNHEKFLKAKSLFRKEKKQKGSEKAGLDESETESDRARAKTEYDKAEDKTEDDKGEAKVEDKTEVKSFSGVGLLMLNLALIGVTLISSILLLGSTSNLLNYAKLILLLGILQMAAIVDFKKKIIPNLLIALGIGIRLVIYVLEFILVREDFFAIMINDLIGFGIGFGLLFIVALISRGGLGFGDVKLFGVIGLMSGAIGTYSTLLFSMVFSAVISIVLLLLKKKGRKDSIAFGPCILLGYLVVIAFALF